MIRSNLNADDQNQSKMDSLKELQKFAIELALKAGQMQANASDDRNKSIEQKSSFADMVTETDKAVENYLFNKLREKYPDHCFVGEETTTKKVELTDKPTWLIDPIDGTTNFIHTFPFSCVSIGLLIEKRVVLGIVYSPFIDRLYTAVKGGGAFCNGKPIKVNTNCKSISEALLVSELGNDRDAIKIAAVLENLKAIGFKGHGVRMLGSAALNMCMIAHGGGDAYWEFGLHCWDMAGGAIIVEEAGGVVIDTEGGEIDLMSRRLIAACNSNIAQELSKLLKVQLKQERD